MLKRLFGNRVSFRVYLLELFLFLFIFYAVVMLAVSYISTNHIVNTNAVRYAQEFSDRVGEQVRAHIGEAAEATRVVASFLQQNEAYRELPRNGAFQLSLMWPMLQTLPTLYSLYIADSEGNFVQVRRYPELATRSIDRSSPDGAEEWITRDGSYVPLEVSQRAPEYDPRVREWYRETGELPRNYWSKPYRFSLDGKQGITVSFPVTNPEGNRQLTVGADISLQEVSEFLKHKPVTENARAGVFDTSGRVIAGPVLLKADEEANTAVWLQQAQPQIHERFQEFLQGTEDVFSVKNRDDDAEWVITFKSVGILDWYIVSGIPRKDLNRQAMITINRMLLFSLAAFLMMVALIYLLVSRVSRPLIRISEETSRLRDFDLEHIKPVASNIAEIERVNQSLVSSVGALKAFRSYIPAELVRQLVKQGKGGELGGEKYELTLFFSDIAHFTNASEGLDPQQLMLQLSEYFERVTQEITREEGTVDKYIGDSVMAFWGAPSAVATPAINACRAALEVQRRIEELNARWQAEGKPKFETRIGIHSGEAIVGNVGSSERMNYSAIGDSVNLASRLEGLNKEFGTRIIISEATWSQVHTEFRCRPLGEVVVKGKTQPVKVFELLDDAD